MVSPPTEKLLILALVPAALSVTNAVRFVALPPIRRSPIWPVMPAPLSWKLLRKGVAPAVPESMMVPPAPEAVETWFVELAGGVGRVADDRVGLEQVEPPPDGEEDAVLDRRGGLARGRARDLLRARDRLVDDDPRAAVFGQAEGDRVQVALGAGGGRGRLAHGRIDPAEVEGVHAFGDRDRGRGGAGRGGDPRRGRLAEPEVGHVDRQDAESRREPLGARGELRRPWKKTLPSPSGPFFTFPTSRVDSGSVPPSTISLICVVELSGDGLPSAPTCLVTLSEPGPSSFSVHVSPSMSVPETVPESNCRLSRSSVSG